ncbi:MAG: hypothetical protein IIT45_09665 [Treponema sp.]|nr:hypothetical protein [Treponema sp.]MBQ5570693.1 hypothetical protein [Treponema sp.]
MAELLEAVMLVSFGLSWPISVMKNIRARSAKSMSLGFTLLIIAGYVSGITAKIICGKTNYVLAVYIINLLIVSANVAIYIRNKKLDSLKEAGSKAGQNGGHEGVAEGKVSANKAATDNVSANKLATVKFSGIKKNSRKTRRSNFHKEAV